MNPNNKKVLDIVVVGSGMAGLNFIDKYLQNGKKINVISPSINQNFKVKDKKKIHLLPSQMRGEYKNISNYFRANTLSLKTNCKAIGSLNFGGLSNYWGLQMDNKIFNDQTCCSYNLPCEFGDHNFDDVNRIQIRWILANPIGPILHHPDSNLLSILVRRDVGG